VFSLLPKLLERAGTSDTGGSITGFYAVLVEGDDMNEPISDAVRGILDGHIALERRLANKGHYPAVDVLASISRCMKDVVSPEHRKAAVKFRELLAAYTDAEDLINLGAYARGSNPVVDRAIDMIAVINDYLRQDVYEQDSFGSIVEKLNRMFSEKESIKPARQPAMQTPAYARIIR